MIDIQDSIKIVWLALEGYRQFVIPEGSKENDQAWDDVCTAMATIQEDLGLEEISL
jgi:hypothetical protein